ncbi:tRNA lysidine(34) synthetase TilS [Qipengyuania sp.]|uniref:tRNA lysidine(34) synthetase TilS n=1 Tax=Qipengyuania sp. TaxID=2004515 RepID=UPI0035C7B27A
MPIVARRNAAERLPIDTAPPPELIARFAADLSGLWPEGDGGGARLGIAVSGGPDSLALLVLATEALPGRVEAASVDHGLRPESADEAAFVSDICARIGVPHRILAVEVAPGNLQSEARRARYAALAFWLEERGLAALATAHHLDDQAETLLMRMNRGSGIAGLAGVRARGEVPQTPHPLLRPLLGWRRGELESVVAGVGIVPVRDPSNHDARFDRVRIRHALAGADWIDPEGLARSAAHLGEAEHYIGEQIARAYRERVTHEGGGARYRLGLSDFEAVEITLRIVEKLGGKASRSEAANLVARLRAGSNASLGGILARPDGDEWLFAPEPPRSG